jgi:DnaJ-domain-containing protein 1
MLDKLLLNELKDIVRNYNLKNHIPLNLKKKELITEIEKHLYNDNGVLKYKNKDFDYTLPKKKVKQVILKDTVMTKDKAYRILKIKKDANKAEIKKAYYKLSLIYHPDKPTGNESNFKILKSAYDILK